VTTTLPLTAGAIDMNNAAGLRPDGNLNLEGLDLEGMGSSADRCFAPGGPACPPCLPCVLPGPPMSRAW